MSKEKAVTKSAAESELNEPKFSKEQIVASKRYLKNVDFLNGNLIDGQEYSLDEVDALIDEFMKGQVK